MKKLAQFIENNFNLIFIVSVIAGILFPCSKWMQFALVPTLMLSLFLSFLEINFVEVVRCFKRLQRIILTIILFMIVIPAMLWFLIKPFVPFEYALGFLILALVPPGVTTITLANIAQGNKEWVLVLVITGSFIAPFSIPLMLKWLVGTQVTIDALVMFTKLTIMIVVPFILAFYVKKYVGSLVDMTQWSYKAINISLVAIMTYIPISLYREQIFSASIINFWILLGTYVLFILFHIIGYSISWGQPKADKITTSLSKTYMNSTLAVVIAIEFFSGNTVLTIVFADIPWMTIFGPFVSVIHSNWFCKYVESS
jgi:predicted Na+-dependent transporter